MTPKRLATQFAVVNLIHSRRVRQRDLLTNSERLPASKKLRMVGDPFAERSRRLTPVLTLKRLATQFAVVNLIHSRRVRRRNLSAKGCPP
ncbi:MAG: hypothetical protein LBK82_11085 [Planctomycetaceae bacterium]|nr:hypothetical protein [Planctomycetaceae bacterium]